MPTFHTPINRARAILTQTHVIGDGQFVVDDGSVFGSPSSTNPVRVTATVGGVDAHFSITSRSTNTLVIGGMLEGTSDVGVPSGQAIEVRITAKDLSDIHGAITGLAVSVDKSSCQGRLTVSSGVPVVTSDVTAAGTVYWTPYDGDQVALYDGSSWGVVTFAETAISLASGFSANTNYDVFAYNSGGTLALEVAAWTDTVTRATAIAYQNGVRVKSGDATRRYLGTFRTATATTTEISVKRQLVYNAYNQASSFMEWVNSTDYTVTGTGFDAYNGDASYYLDFVSGDSQAIVGSCYLDFVSSAQGQHATVYTALDFGAQQATRHTTYAAVNGNSYYAISVTTEYRAIGYHTFSTLMDYEGGIDFRMAVIKLRVIN